MPEQERQISRFMSIFAGGTLFSRVLGMVRDMMLAAWLGPASRDAFFVAFRLPNMLRDLVGEGAMNAALVPAFSAELETGSRESFQRLVRAVMMAMLLLLLVLTVIGVLLAPLLLHSISALRFLTHAAPRTSDELSFAATLTRWTFPYLFFIGMAVFAMGPLFALRRYAAPSWSPALLNVALIFACLVLIPLFEEPAYALVIGVWLGGIAQLAVLWYAMRRHSGVYLPSFEFGHPGIREVFMLMVPVVIGQAAGEVNKLVDTLFAYSLVDGTVSALFYANRLIQLPLSVFGFATAAAVLPVISAASARQDDTEIRNTLMHGFRQCIFFILPSMVGLVIFGRSIIRLLFERGEFGPEQAAMTSTALSIYAFGLLSFSLVKVAVTGFYGIKDTKTPVIVSALSMLLNILLNCVLVGPLQYRGLAFATTISYTANFIVLYILLGERFGRLWNIHFLSALLRMVLATGLSITLGYAVLVRIAALFSEDTLIARITCVGMAIGLSVGAYLLLAHLFNLKEVQYMTHILRRRSPGHIS